MSDRVTRGPNRTPASPRTRSDTSVVTPSEESARAVERQFESTSHTPTPPRTPGHPRASAEEAPRRMRVVRGTPSAPNEITVHELEKLDPEGGPLADWANALVVTFMISDTLTREQAIDQLLDGHSRGEGAARHHEEQRIDQTIRNMVERGVLIEKDGRLRSNIDLR